LSRLSDRVRSIVRPAGNQQSAINHQSAINRQSAINQQSAISNQQFDLSPLGGGWRDGCFLVERRWKAAAKHGREAIGSLAATLEQAAHEAPLFCGGSDARPPFVFFDLETTGLNGGAGTHVFLVGCGWFEGEEFLTRQYVLTRFADERPLLSTLARELSRAGALVSFNGKSFDAPLLETRYLFHRLEWSGAALPHVDVLHPARLFWRGRPLSGGAAAQPWIGDLGRTRECSLTSLERQLVGYRRAGDVPGFEIPARYFQFVRSGDAGPLTAVLEHNRLDLLALASLTARLFGLARQGPDATRDAREALALGRVYARAGLDDRACAAFERAVALSRAPAGAYDAVTIESVRMLALAYRRARDFEAAARCWQRLLDTRGCPETIAREASEALAIHNEHRRHDLASARTFALRNLDYAERGMRPAWTQAVKHRLSRIDRKLLQERTLDF
jgi:uncharacterized protein YprB with RNaseH-like and TPR domain